MASRDDELAAPRRQREDARYQEFRAAICGNDPTSQRYLKYSHEQLRSLYELLLAPNDYPANIVIATCRFHGLPEWRASDPANDPHIIECARRDAENGTFFSDDTDGGDIKDLTLLLDWYSSAHSCEDCSDFARPYDGEAEQQEYDRMIKAIEAALGGTVHPDRTRWSPKAEADVISITDRTDRRDGRNE